MHAATRMLHAYGMCQLCCVGPACAFAGLGTPAFQTKGQDMFTKTYIRARNAMDRAMRSPVDKDRGQMPPWGWGIVIVLIAVVCIILIIQNVDVKEK